MTSQSDLPLTGLSVIELAAIGPVPHAGWLLQQLGATVTRVVPPTDRGLGIPVDDRYDVLNHGKSRVALDLKKPDGQHKLISSLGESDVLIEGFRPGVLERLGLPPDRMLSTQPRLIIGRLSGFGHQGNWAPRAGHDINYLAVSGVLNACGPNIRPSIPLNLIGDFGGGAMHLVVGVLAALVQRGISGAGGVISSSILAGTHGLTPMLHGLIAADQWSLQRQSNLLDGGAPFYRCYATSDQRYVAVGALEPKFYTALLELTKLSGRLDPARQYDRETWPDMSQCFSDAFAQQDRDTWTKRAASSDCCVTPVLDFREAAQWSHNVSNGWFDATHIEPRNTIEWQAFTPMSSPAHRESADTR